MPRYAEPTDLVARYDIRTIGQLASDDEQKLSRTAILTHENVLAALDDASGRVEAALRHGARYTLENLVTDLTDNSLSHLKAIVCTIAMTRLLRRRPGTYTDLLQQVSAEAEEFLKQLSSGYDVFSIDANVAAGLIDDTGTGNTESVHLIKQRNLISDLLIGRQFPHRGEAGRRHRNYF